MTDGQGTEAGLQAEMDKLSLSQALVDFEVANTRVLDLTRRLLEAQAEIGGLRGELEQARAEQLELKQVHDAMKSSQAFRTASKIWALRNVVGR